MKDTEPKIEFKDEKSLTEVLDLTYFHHGNNGNIKNNIKKYSITIKKEDPNYKLFKGWVGCFVKIANVNVILGTAKFLVESESDDSIVMYPLNTYCIVQEDKYSLY